MLASRQYPQGGERPPVVPDLTRDVSMMMLHGFIFGSARDPKADSVVYLIVLYSPKIMELNRKGEIVYRV